MSGVAKFRPWPQVGTSLGPAAKLPCLPACLPASPGCLTNFLPVALSRDMAADQMAVTLQHAPCAGRRTPAPGSPHRRRRHPPCSPRPGLAHCPHYTTAYARMCLPCLLAPSSPFSHFHLGSSRLTEPSPPFPRPHVLCHALRRRERLQSGDRAVGGDASQRKVCAGEAPDQQVRAAPPGAPLLASACGADARQAAGTAALTQPCRVPALPALGQGRLPA